MDKALLSDQTIAAFDYLERLFSETTFLIKELEGRLRREEEEFIIGRGRGYSVSAYSSTSLESTKWWLYKRLSVFFVPKADATKAPRGTSTAIKEGLKVIFMKVLYREETIKTPKILMGIISKIDSPNRGYKRIEDVVTPYFDYLLKWENQDSGIRERSYKDKFLSFQERYFVWDLFDVNSSGEVQEKLVKPVLELYRQTI